MTGGRDHNTKQTNLNAKLERKSMTDELKRMRGLLSHWDAVHLGDAYACTACGC